MSPIKGITNVYRPQRQGKIHLGIKEHRKGPAGDVEFPKEVDYFVLKDSPELWPFYGGQDGKPKLLHVTLPSARFDRELEGYKEKVFPQWLKKYRLSGLICKGDGATAMRVNEDTGELEETVCPCEELTKGGCTRMGLFRFRVQEIPTFNIYQISTSSFNSLVNLNSFIRDLLEFCYMHQVDPSSIKLVLRRDEETVQRLEKGKVKKSRHWVMKLDLDDRFYKNLDEVPPKALPIGRAPKPLELPPVDETKDPLFPPYDKDVQADEESEPEAEAKEDEPTKDIKKTSEETIGRSAEEMEKAAKETLEKMVKDGVVRTGADLQAAFIKASEAIAGGGAKTKEDNGEQPKDAVKAKPKKEGEHQYAWWSADVPERLKQSLLDAMTIYQDKGGILSALTLVQLDSMKTEERFKVAIDWLNSRILAIEKDEKLKKKH